MKVVDVKEMVAIMATTLRLLKHSWMKEEDAYLVELSHPATRDLLNRSFPHYDELSYIFGKDRATRARVESFTNVESNDPVRYETFAADATPDMEFQPMHSQGLDMSSDELMGIRTTQVSEGRHVLSGFKQKRGVQPADSGDVIRTTIEYKNEQLNHIVDWIVLQRQDASQTRQEVVQQLETIPELTLMDRCRLIRILMRNVDNMKAFLDVPDKMKFPYYNIILQENS
uniref:Retrotransposon protein n=1 Tax=Cucumis melo TaxID=3656 RepID=A0A9I9EK79_CUCME